MFECAMLFKITRCYLGTEHGPFLVDQATDCQVVKVTKHVTETIAFRQVGGISTRYYSTVITRYYSTVIAGPCNSETL